MEQFEREMSSHNNDAMPGALPRVEVHVLSEFVFCPRAAILALESGKDTGDEEQSRGPKLDSFVDYSEHRFVEALENAWGRVRLWGTLMAPALLLVLAAWWLHSPFAAVVVSLPLVVLAAKMWETFREIVRLIREFSAFQAATPVEIDLTSTEVREVNWWSLRKAGFDCLKPRDSYQDHAEQLSGRPWRLLIKDTVVRVPVVRKHRGKRDWGKQHVVRLAAYCRLIEACESADAPFGVLMFAGSYDCVLIPNTPETRERLQRALDDARRFIIIHSGGEFAPVAPNDNRCRGCHLGKPRWFVANGSETELDGKKLRPRLTRQPNADKKSPLYHCNCGDRFDWVPPHEHAVELGIAKE